MVLQTGIAMLGRAYINKDNLVRSRNTSSWKSAFHAALTRPLFLSDEGCRKYIVNVVSDSPQFVSIQLQMQPRCNLRASRPSETKIPFQDLRPRCSKTSPSSRTGKSALYVQCQPPMRTAVCLANLRGEV